MDNKLLLLELKFYLLSSADADQQHNQKHMTAKEKKVGFR